MKEALDWNYINSKEHKWDQLSCTVQCIKCQEWVLGKLWFDSKNSLVDSFGFVVESDGATCDQCLGEDPEPSRQGTRLGVAIVVKERDKGNFKNN